MEEHKKIYEEYGKAIIMLIITIITIFTTIIIYYSNIKDNYKILFTIIFIIINVYNIAITSTFIKQYGNNYPIITTSMIISFIALTTALILFLFLLLIIISAAKTETR